ncbi:MAG: DUF445 family protein [Syntrophomonadaceae bacterium]|nr:DUF445 family protein [Syntrophomonadaceae bacterium]
MSIKLIIIPLISALIGYFTNVVAIKLLFWPQQPINFRIFQLHGLLPKRQANIASSIGELVENQLLSMDELIDKIDTPEINNKITIKLSKILKDRLYTLLPSIIPARVTQVIGENLDKILRQEAPQLIKQVISSGRDHLNREIQIKKIVEDKVNAYDLNELEAMIRGISSTELTFIEISGGVLGFIIGLIQIGIIMLFPN